MLCVCVCVCLFARSSLVASLSRLIVRSGLRATSTTNVIIAVIIIIIIIIIITIAITQVGKPARTIDLPRVLSQLQLEIPG